MNVSNIGSLTTNNIGHRSFSKPILSIAVALAIITALGVYYLYSKGFFSSLPRANPIRQDSADDRLRRSIQARSEAIGCCPPCRHKIQREEDNPNPSALEKAIQRRSEKITNSIFWKPGKSCFVCKNQYSEKDGQPI